MTTRWVVTHELAEWKDEIAWMSLYFSREIAAAIDMAQTSGAAALNVLASPMLFGNRQLIMERVAALRLPAIPG